MRLTYLATIRPKDCLGSTTRGQPTLELARNPAPSKSPARPNRQAPLLRRFIPKTTRAKLARGNDARPCSPCSLEQNSGAAGRSNDAQAHRMAPLPVTKVLADLAPSRKQLMDTVRLIAYRAETALVSVVRDSSSLRGRRPSLLLRSVGRRQTGVRRNAAVLNVVHSWPNPRSNRAIHHR